MVAPSTDRSELLQRLGKVFAQHGYAGASLTQLASAAGMNKSSLYHYFPGGKREMAAALLRQAIANLETNAFARLQSPAAPAARLQSFLDGFVDYLDAGTGHCLLAVLAQDGSQAPARTQIAAQVADWAGQLAITLEEGGVKRKRAQRLAAELLNQLYGSLLLGKMLNDPKHFLRTVRRLGATLSKNA
jgi:TetR/AcrR family transcriptional repressor of lmrAB and yxaGH operons